MHLTLENFSYITLTFEGIYLIEGSTKALLPKPTRAGWMFWRFYGIGQEEDNKEGEGCPHFYFLWGAMTFTITAFSIMTLSIMTLSIMTLSIMTLSIMTLIIMTLSIMALSIMTLSITALSTMTLSLKTLSILTFNIMTLSIINTTWHSV
jgi:hypothetical protein